MTSFRLTVLIGGATSLTRLLGFIRDVLLAALFGAGPVADAFFLALRIPNLVRRLMGEGGWTGAYVPIATKLIAAKDVQREQSLARDSLFNITLLTAFIVIMGELFAGEIIHALAPGLSPERFNLSVVYVRALFLLMMGATLTSLLSAILISQKKFTLQAIVPVLVNAALVSFLIYLNQTDSSERPAVGLILAWAASGATFVQVLVLALPVSSHFKNTKLFGMPRGHDFFPMIALALPSFLIQFGSQFGILILLNHAAQYPASISHLTYAERLAQLPYGFIAAGLSTVALPEFAAQLLNKDRTDLYRSIDRVFFLSMALAVPAALALVILAEPIVSVLFERGAFGSADRIGTAMALAGFVVGLPFAAIGRVQTQLYFAHERIRVPLFAVLFSNLLIVGCLHLSLFSHSLFGWALAFSLGQLALCVVQHLGLTSLTGWTPDPVFRMKLYKILAASGLMGFALLVLNDHYGAALLADRGGVWRWAGLTAFCATGLGIYAAAIYFFGLWRQFR